MYMDSFFIMIRSYPTKRALKCSSCIWKTASSRSQHTTLRPDLAGAGQDCIGPADPVSRLRPVHFHIPHQETPLQATYRAAREDTQGWNQAYWSNHNASFEKEKQAFITRMLSEKYKDGALLGDTPTTPNLTAEEMAEFYKQFLDSNYDRHMQYNTDWYSRCFVNLKLALRVWLQQLRAPQDAVKV